MHELSLVVALSALLSIITISNANSASLTANAQAEGFQLNTFVSSIPSFNPVGPGGIVNTIGGNILISDYVTGQIRSFSDTNNQAWVSGIAATTNYGSFNASGLSSIGGNYYMAEQSSGKVVQVNADGSYKQVIVSIPNATGIVGNGATGHLYVSNVSQVFDVNPVTKTYTVFNTIPADGLSLSPDGTTLYMADMANNHIYGFNTATKAQVFDSGFVAGGVDGTVLGSGKLAGNLFVNTNGGTLIKINLTTLVQTMIFSGGSRGDFVTVDASTNNLLLIQTDSILRLTAPSGGGFTPPPSATPLPAVWTFATPLVAGLWGSTFRRKTKANAVRRNS